MVETLCLKLAALMEMLGKATCGIVRAQVLRWWSVEIPCCAEDVSGLFERVFCFAGVEERGCCCILCRVSDAQVA